MVSMTGIHCKDVGLHYINSVVFGSVFFGVSFLINISCLVLLATIRCTLTSLTGKFRLLNPSDSYRKYDIKGIPHFKALAILDFCLSLYPFSKCFIALKLPERRKPYCLSQVHNNMLYPNMIKII